MTASNLLRKLISTITLISILFFSQQSTANEANYKQALKFFNDKQYEAAYKAFTQLVESDYGSIKYNFYLARAATLTHRFDEAIITYERILILEPNNTRSKLELAKLYYQQGTYKLSELYFKSALQDNVPLQVEENINQFLAKIKKTQNKSSFTGLFIFGTGHDTNVNTAATADSWYLPAFALEFDNTTKQIESNFHQETAVINHYYDATEKYGFGIKNNLLAYSKSLPGESEYNILFTRYTPSLIFDYGDYQFETALEYNYMRYGADAYLESYGLAPKLSYSASDIGFIFGQIKVLKKHYLQTVDKERDALYTELNVQYQKLIGSNMAFVFYTTLQQERKETGNRYDVDYDRLGMRLALSYYLPQDWQLGVSAEVKGTNYLDNNPFFLEKRQDRNRNLTLNVSKRIGKNLSAQLNLSRTSNDSNQELYTYDKDIVMLNLITRF